MRRRSRDADRARIPRALIALSGTTEVSVQFLLTVVP